MFYRKEEYTFWKIYIVLFISLYVFIFCILSYSWMLNRNIKFSSLFWRRGGEVGRGGGINTVYKALSLMAP